MKERLTNTEFVTNLMEFSPQGALCQAFIIEAITRYATVCAKEPAKTFDSAFLPGAAWVAVAKDIQQRIKDNYGRS